VSHIFEEATSIVFFQVYAEETLVGRKWPLKRCSALLHFTPPAAFLPGFFPTFFNLPMHASTPDVQIELVKHALGSEVASAYVYFKLDVNSAAYKCLACDLRSITTTCK